MFQLVAGGGGDASSLSPSQGNAPSSGSDNGGSSGGTVTPALGPLTDIRFDNPRNIEADESGNLYVVDGPFEAARILQITPSGSVLTLLDNGSNIGELAVTPAGDVFYSTVGSDQDNASARADTVWRLVDGAPAEVAYSDVGMVQGIAVDPRSNDIYISSTRATIKKITADGSVTPLFSFEQGGLINDMAFQGDSLWIVRAHMPLSSDIYRWTQGEGVEEIMLNSPMPFNSIVTTDAGIYMAKSGFSRFSSGYISCMIEWYDFSTEEITPVAGKSGACGYQDGAGESATLNVIDNVTRGSDGNLYLTDQENEVIRRVTPQGQVSLFAGMPQESGNW